MFLSWLLFVKRKLNLFVCLYQIKVLEMFLSWLLFATLLDSAATHGSFLGCSSCSLLEGFLLFLLLLFEGQIIIIKVLISFFGSLQRFLFATFTTRHLGE